MKELKDWLGPIADVLIPAEGEMPSATAAGVADAQLEQVLGAGDHRIVIGRVVLADGAAGEPLLYYDGDYHRLTGFGATP